MRMVASYWDYMLGLVAIWTRCFQKWWAVKYELLESLVLRHSSRDGWRFEFFGDGIPYFSGGGAFHKSSYDLVAHAVHYTVVDKSAFSRITFSNTHKEFSRFGKSKISFLQSADTEVVLYDSDCGVSAILFHRKESAIPEIKQRKHWTNSFKVDSIKYSSFHIHRLQRNKFQGIGRFQRLQINRCR
ncbi:hypothetical protein ROZALSC1DRAFT_24387 [Rozella allomycis CSF55]|uniref:Uncharacterized protein n=1 Tax=Rozella allomycis (strain CSF55) TaxID=988480 RepID=A0A4P9YCZ1_ROZAC|nr:hypothetical protein ROZALSC1DRAFT_24387 [Rozella allomycis CSF55]